MTSTRTLTILVGGTILTLDGVKTVKNKQVKVDLKGNMVVDVMRHLTINANTIMTGEVIQTTLKVTTLLRPHHLWGISYDNICRQMMPFRKTKHFSFAT